MVTRQYRDRLGFERGQVGHMVVERLQPPEPGVAQDLVEAAAFGFAGKQRDAERLRLGQLGGHVRQHRDAA